LLEVAAENNLKLAENFMGKGDLVTEAITRASSKITKKAWSKIKMRCNSN
jgi:hypothetical protein